MSFTSDRKKTYCLHCQFIHLELLVSTGKAIYQGLARQDKTYDLSQTIIYNHSIALSSYLNPQCAACMLLLIIYNIEAHSSLPVLSLHGHKLNYQSETRHYGDAY